jgi:hypothetical protein
MYVCHYPGYTASEAIDIRQCLESVTIIGSVKMAQASIMEIHAQHGEVK